MEELLPSWKRRALELARHYREEGVLKKKRAIDVVDDFESIIRAEKLDQPQMIHDEVVVNVEDPHNCQPREIATARDQWKLASEEINKADLGGPLLRGCNSLLNSVDYILAFMEKTHSVPLHAMQWDYSALEQRVAALMEMSKQEGVAFPLNYNMPKSWDEYDAQEINRRMKRAAKREGKWGDDQLQFPRLLAELWAAHEMSEDTETCWSDGTPHCEGFFSVKVRDLEQSMDLPWDDVKELFERAERAFERIKGMTLSLGKSSLRAAGEEFVSWLHNELDNNGKHWTLDGHEVVDWRAGKDHVEVELSNGKHLRMLVEEVVDAG